MKTVENQGAQGDVLFRRIDKLPDGLVKQERGPEGLVVAHSETGHHHVIPTETVAHYAQPAGDGLMSYLSVDTFADVVHLRPFDTHETVRLDAGNWEVRRQREHTPEGWRRVED